MGIRYYAYPITAAEYPHAVENPCRFHGRDPLADAWGLKDEQPEMLYLDKCWQQLQTLLGPNSGAPARPAFQLVEGQVTHVDMGWIPHERALSPEDVQLVAADLATVDESDIRRMLPSMNWWNDSEEQIYEYVAHHLAAAQEFTAKLANGGHGLVYLIG